jgi:hypothetical protein
VAAGRELSKEKPIEKSGRTGGSGFYANMAT